MNSKPFSPGPESVDKNRTAEKNEGLNKQSNETVKISSQLDGVSDIIDTAAESVEMGEVSESESKGKNKGAQNKMTSSTNDDVFAGKKPVTLPKVEVMRHQVEVAIMKEIKILEKQADQIKRNPAGNAHKLNGIVAQIRNLHYVLSMLAQATFDTLRGWWFKYVQGN